MTEDSGSIRTKFFKIIVIGDSNVGKTCLTFRFCENRFHGSTEATIGVDFRERNLEIGRERLVLQLWDTAGQERFRQSMVSHYYRKVDAVVIVYDITRKTTFESVPRWMTECNRHDVCQNIPRILIGNKSDCESDREVPISLAQSLADKYDMPVFETSAKENSENDHIESIFMTLALKLNSRKSMKFSSTVGNGSPNISVSSEENDDNSNSWGINGCC